MEIYSLVPDSVTRSKTPGNKWNIIDLSRTTNNSIITIQLTECYSNNRVSIPDIYYGTQNGITLSYIKYALFKVGLSSLMIVFGASLMLIYLVIGKRHEIKRGYVWLALLAIYRGFWTLIETNIYSFFTTRLIMVSQLSYLCLKMAVITFLMFINVSFRNNKDKFYRILMYISAFDFWISIMLQYSGTMDFAYTIYLTHIILFVGCVYTCITTFIILYNYQKSKNGIADGRKNLYYSQFGATIFTLITALCDLIRYYISNSPDKAYFSRIGDLLYVMIIIVTLLTDSIYLIRTGQEADMIKEKAALDPMTNLRNRAAFEQDLNIL